MLAQQIGTKIPSKLIPRCPICGKLLIPNLRIDNKFVEDDGWHRASKNYSDFIEGIQCQPVLFLELGVGFNTPGIIKYSFWKMVSNNDKAMYAVVNLEKIVCPEPIRDRAIFINCDIGEAIHSLVS